MPPKLLVDTDVLVDFLRGYPEAVNYVKTHSKEIVISAVTVAELYAGVKDAGEQEELDRFLALFPVLPVNFEIARQGGLYKRDFYKSHNVGLGDAQIAAAAGIYRAALVTLNVKHFPMFEALKPPYSKK